MALKDWKKESHSTPTDMTYERYDDEVGLTNSSINIWKKTNGEWVVEILPHGRGAVGETRDTFKTKPQAINAAKTYMRTH